VLSPASDPRSWRKTEIRYGICKRGIV
jgi:hypothetical protein